MHPLALLVVAYSIPHAQGLESTAITSRVPTIPTVGQNSSAVSVCSQPRVPNDSGVDSGDIKQLLETDDVVTKACTLESLSAGFFTYKALYLNITRKGNAIVASSDAGICKNAFTKIMSSCLVGNTSTTYWGGSVTEDGVEYSISNSVYPSNALDSTSTNGTNASALTQTARKTSLTSLPATRSTSLNTFAPASNSSSSRSTTSTTSTRNITNTSTVEKNSTTVASSTRASNISTLAVIVPGSIAINGSSSTRNTGTLTGTMSTTAVLSTTSSLGIINSTTVKPNVSSSTTSLFHSNVTTTKTIVSSGSTTLGLSNSTHSETTGSASTSRLSSLSTTASSPVRNISTSTTSVSSSMKTSSLLATSSVLSSSTTGSANNTSSAVSTSHTNTPTATPTGTHSSASITSTPSVASNTDGLITSTITDVPDSVSTETVSGLSFTENAWITTSHDGNSSTIVPVFVGCPGCGGLGRGVIVWGIPQLIQVSFQLPKFPNLPSFHFPCIPIPLIKSCSSPPTNDNGGKPGPPSRGGPDTGPPNSGQNGNPTNTEEHSTSTKTTSKSTSESASSSSSKSECPETATKTVTDCDVVCSTVTESSRSTETCSTTCTSTRTGCSISGTTSTTTSDDSCSAIITPGPDGKIPQGKCGSCPATRPVAATEGEVAITMDPSELEEDNGLKKRAIAGRVTHVVTIVRRGPAVMVTQINKCALTTPAAKPVVTPSYLGGPEFWTSEDQKALVSPWVNVPRYFMIADDGCIATVVEKKVSDFKNDLSVPNLKMSTDHAYENGWLAVFMKNVLGGDKKAISDPLTCPEANDLFFSTCGKNFLASIYGALASERHPNFWVMSDALNSGSKGRILGASSTVNVGRDAFNIHSDWDANVKRIKNKLGLLETITLGGLVVNLPNFLDGIQATNDRVFSRIKDLDTFLADKTDIRRHDFGFADRYKTHMDKLATKFNRMNGNIKTLLGHLQQDLPQLKTHPDFQNQKEDKEKQWNELNSQFNAYSEKYGSENHPAAFQISFRYTYVPRADDEADGLKRRDDTCELPSSSGVSSTASTLSSNLVSTSMPRSSATSTSTGVTTLASSTRPLTTSLGSSNVSSSVGSPATSKSTASLITSLPPLTTTSSALDPKATIRSCGVDSIMKFGGTQLSFPRDRTPDLLGVLRTFCQAFDKDIKLERGKLLWKASYLPRLWPGRDQGNVIVAGMKWDDQEACKDIPQPALHVHLDGQNILHDDDCVSKMHEIANGCDAADGQDKNGGSLQVGCVTYQWLSYPEVAEERFTFAEDIHTTNSPPATAPDHPIRPPDYPSRCDALGC